MSAPENKPRAYSPLWELIRSRLTEFIREPEALFWVYGFPIVMTLMLGIAFRNQPVKEIVVAVVGEGTPAAEAQKALSVAKTTEIFKAEVFPEEEARLKLRTAKVDLVVKVNGDGKYEYM